jgi:hypothetical protein
MDVSVKAVLTVLRVVGDALPPPSPTVIAVSIGVPTTKPAEVMVVLAAESAVPCSYCGFSFFSFTLCTFTAVIGCHIMRSNLLEPPMCLQLS